MSEATNENLGKYRITAELGRGGFATVYKAVDTTLDREVALKVLDPLLLRDETFLTRFRREAKAVARLNHPHIITVHEVGEHQGQHFIAMPYLPGPNLAQLIAQQGAMDPTEVVRLAEQVASALDYAHREGLIHRDIKPANVLLNERGEAVLTDFGIAKAVGESTVLTRTGASIGTPQYMAPEQWTTGRVDARSDVYAFGIMVYQMLTGQVPFDGETSRIMYGHVHETPPPPQALNPALPPGVEPVLLKALAKDPAQRYGTAGEMVAALKAALARRVVVEPPPRPAPTPKPIPAPRLKPAWPVHPALVAGALAAVAVVAGVILLAGRGGPTATPVPVAERATTPAPTSAKVAAVAPTATLAPTPTRRPTATPTRTPTSTPTRTPTSTPTLTPLPDAIIDAETGDLRAGPGPEYDIIGQVKKGDRVEVSTKNPAGDWVKVEVSGQSGWLSVSLLKLNISLSSVPVETDIPPTPTPASTPISSGRIAFTSGRDGNWEIYVMNADGSGQTNLTNNPAGDWDPSWSPDGQRIAFTSERDDNGEIYVMNADGSGQTRLTNNPADDEYLSWSPDGKRIAFTSNRDGNDEIYVMNADGSGQTNLTNHPAKDWWPSWSPDGQRIAFVSDRDGNCEIYVMNADGSRQTNLTNNPANDEWPSWSPDGQRIAFTSRRDDNGEIYVMNADGSGVARLTNHSAWDWGPSWSPDGKRIAFVSDRDDNLEIYVMNADGSGQTRLTNNPADDGRPSWSPR